MLCQLPQVLTQGDAAWLLATDKQLLSTYATGQRVVKNRLGDELEPLPTPGQSPIHTNTEITLGRTQQE